jgi:hypothetical protein
LQPPCCHCHVIIIIIIISLLLTWSRRWHWLQIFVKTRAMKLLAPLAARLEATHVSFRGRLNLGLQLSTEPPGIT